MFIETTLRHVIVFLDRSKDFSRVNFLIELPSSTIFSWYVPGKDNAFTSSEIKKKEYVLWIFLTKY